MVLVGRSFAGTRRHGKYLFVRVSEASWLVLHFGMTGDLLSLPESADVPEHTRLLVTFGTGERLAYDSVRKLGEIALTPTLAAFVIDRNLGPDMMALNPEAFQEILARHRGTVKSTLMNQHIVAGLGNVYVDESLFQAGIAPTARVDRLPPEAVGRLHGAIVDVVGIAIARQAQTHRLPEGFLLHHRTPGAPCPRCGAVLQRVQVGGRSTYFCPAHQTEGGES